MARRALTDDQGEIGVRGRAPVGDRNPAAIDDGETSAALPEREGLALDQHDVDARGPKPAHAGARDPPQTFKPLASGREVYFDERRSTPRFKRRQHIGAARAGAVAP